MFDRRNGRRLPDSSRLSESRALMATVVLNRSTLYPSRDVEDFTECGAGSMSDMFLLSLVGGPWPDYRKYLIQAVKSSQARMLTWANRRSNSNLKIIRVFPCVTPQSACEVSFC